MRLTGPWRSRLSTAKPLTPQQRTLRARLAAHRSWAKTSDRRARTENASKAFLERFEREVDPDGILSADIRAQMADSARKAFYTKLAFKSTRARAVRKRGSAGDDRAV
jgi:hypothetical protein